MWASERPCVRTATFVTRLAVCRKGSTTPAMSKTSRVRGKIASAFECSDWAARASMSRQRRPRRAHSLARNSPTGPAPTIRTSVSTADDPMACGLALPHRPPRELEDVEGLRGDADLVLGVADHDHAERAGHADRRGPGVRDLAHPLLVDACAELLFHPHPSAAGPA